MSANDDDLYGDLYGNDTQDAFPGFDPNDEPDEPPKPLTEPAAAPPTTTKPATTTATETKTAPATLVKKEEPKPAPIPKREEPETNPIPTFTDDGGSSYSMPTNQKYGQGGHTDANSRFAQGASASLGGLNQTHQGIEALGGNDSRPSNSRDEGKMFVGGLNWDTTDEGLRNYFSQFGKIESCTIMRDPAGRSRGFAFLTFEDPAAVNKVMVQEHFLDGKIIDPKRAIPRTEHQRTVKMFVGGLAPSVTTDSMREYFSQFGNVIDATVMVDRDSSRSKGFGFVTFDDQSGAERLFGMPGLQIDGKMIEVKMAQPRAGMAADRNNNNTNNMINNNSRGPVNNNMNMGGGGNTPFDPQALATLYQRMAQLAGGGQGGMNWGVNGGMGMNPMMGMGGGMGMMNGAGGMMGGAGMGVPQGGGGGNMRNYGNGMMNGPNGMGMMADGGMGGAGGAGMRGGSIPRGPAAMRGGAAGGGVVPTGPSGGLGPARMGGRHQHNYHPYSR